MKNTFEEINAAMNLHVLSKAEIIRRLGVSQQGFAHMIKSKTLSLEKYIRLCKIIDIDPCKFIGDSTEIFTSKTVEEIETQKEIQHLREKMELLEELLAVYKKQIKHLQ
jgi:transcriptional regulator with XRE-family HTH domain